MQRVALAKRCFAEPGPYQTLALVTAPALQRTASQELRAALRPGNANYRSRICECMPIPVLRTSLILIVSCSMRGRFLEAILSADRAKAGRNRGAPERSTAWWLVERWEALRLALGAHGALPCEVGTLIPPQGCPLVPWRLPPLHRLARFARDWQTSDALRRENAKVWLFEM
jgi:hypothetical protein